MGSADLFFEMEEEREKLRSDLLKESEDAFKEKLYGEGEDLIPQPRTGVDGFLEKQKADGVLSAEYLLEAMRGAQKINPETAVKIHKLSEKTGMPYQEIAKDPITFETIVQAKEMADSMSPVLSEKAPSLAMFAHDDFENLNEFERTYNDWDKGLSRGMLTR